MRRGIQRQQENEKQRERMEGGRIMLLKEGRKEGESEGC